SNAVKKEEAGYGIGLFTVRYIIEKHGGEVSFESKEGEGTVFTVSIPLKKS
ncbi:MAG TPA: ATP-binding protein, partial [Candidatus Paceibacterota bacterium]|nr:ATP-binding protein [Candidatus Paceibacterota bacterium]